MALVWIDWFEQIEVFVQWRWAQATPQPTLL